LVTVWWLPGFTSKTRILMRRGSTGPPQRPRR